jgi:cytochrome b
MALEDAAGQPSRATRATPPHPPAYGTAALRVWDPFVRVFHWLLVAGFVVNYFELVRAGKTAHQVIGYVVLGLVTLRIIWGFVGPRHARFIDFVRRPGAVLEHLRSLARHRDGRYVGHSPAGGAMVVLLLAVITALGATGWLSRTDWFFGVKWMEEAHEILASTLLALVILHVLGVAHACWRHRENLVKSMVTGRKRPPESADAEPHA